MTEAYRKIDIDAYDEDVLLESDLVEPDPRDPATVLSETKAKSTQLRGFLSKSAGFPPIRRHPDHSCVQRRYCGGPIIGAGRCTIWT